MKKYINILRSGILTLFVIVLSSCSDKEVLDLKPYNQISDELAFSSVANVEKSIIGIYNAAQVGYFERGGKNLERGYPFGAAYFEQNDCRGGDVINTQAFYRYTYKATYSPNTDNNKNYWESLYRLINRSNLVIEGINKAKEQNILDANSVNPYIAQALFFRAYSHLELLKHFSRPYNHTSNASHMGVPYLTKPSNSIATALENSKEGRGTVKEAYEKILKDLNTAENYFDDSKNTYRATKYAVIALKTRVYLNMGKWDLVISEANKLNGKYSLASSPDDPFSNPESNTESIFSLQNSNTNNPSVNGALAAMYNGRSLIAISPVIWNSKYWDANDKRRDMTRKAKNGIYSTKYKDVSNYSDASPLFRYAEVLLNRAEAKFRLKDPSFIDDLNAVRGRSTNNIYSISHFKDDAEKIKAILFERRIEFLAEGMRWGDIHRLQNDDLVGYNGIPAKYENISPYMQEYVIGTGYIFKYGVKIIVNGEEVERNDLKPIPYSDFRFLWPIPTSEVSVNSVLKKQQNPGW